MVSKKCIVRLSLSLILLGLVAVVPALAGSAVVGSVAGSMNATVGGQTLLPNTTIFSGDSLQVKDGVAVVALGGASRMVFGRDTAALFLRDPDEVTVLLNQGNVSVFHDGNGAPVRMKIGDVAISPVSGFKTLGEVAMLNGAVVVSAKDGMLRVVKGNGQVVNVAKGKTITVAPQAKASGGAAAGSCCGGSGTALEVGAIGAGGVAAILAGIAMKRAGDAKTTAAAAETAAASAATAAAQATSAASAAVAAVSALSAAELYNTVSVGCGLDQLWSEQQLPSPSPYTPPAGVLCSNPATW